jgi:hypothetical protein
MIGCLQKRINHLEHRMRELEVEHHYDHQTI